MMRVLVDAGPLVALFSKRDTHHDWALRFFKELKPPLLTCDAVLAETLYLLRSDPSAIPFILGLVERRVVEPGFSVASQSTEVKKLMIKYRDTPMDFADACLVRMTELNADSCVWTLDTDFQIYRRNGRARIPLILPDFSN